MLWLVMAENQSLLMQGKQCYTILILALLLADYFDLGLNDFIKDAIMNPEVEEVEEVEDLSGTKIIWDDKNQNRYRAHLIYYFHRVACS